MGVCYIIFLYIVKQLIIHFVFIVIITILCIILFCHCITHFFIAPNVLAFYFKGAQFIFSIFLIFNKIMKKFWFFIHVFNYHLFFPSSFFSFVVYYFSFSL